MPGRTGRVRKVARTLSTSISTTRYPLETKPKNKSDGESPKPVPQKSDQKDGRNDGNAFDPRELVRSLTEEISPAAEDRGMEFLSRIDPSVPGILIGNSIAVRKILRTILCLELGRKHFGWIGIGLHRLPENASGCVFRFEIQSAGMHTPPKSTGTDPGECRRNVYFGADFSSYMERVFGPLRRLGCVLYCEHDKNDWDRFFFDIGYTVAEGSPEIETEREIGVISGRVRDGFLRDAGPASSKTGILLIQKKSFIRKTVENLLSDSGFSVTTAESDVLDGEIPDRIGLIILDAALPHGESIDVLVRFRMDPAYQRYRSVPIVMLTAHAREENIRKLFMYGVDDYVFKPVESEELIRSVRRLFPNSEIGDSNGGRPKRMFVPAEVAGIRLLFSSHPDLLKEIARLFPIEVCRHLFEMKNGIRNTDFQGVARAAHCLVSDAGVAGTSPATDHLRDIIEAAGRKDFRRILWLYPFLPAEFLRISSILSEAAAG